MSPDLSTIIAEVIAAKSGNKEFLLYYFAPDYKTDTPWRAEIGNPSHSVMLGMGACEFRANGETAEAAVANLLAKVKSDAPRR